jgi:prolyl-tRNA editing enzyme YbaK/EbsC (Cys-tRNA(Pro) deacylase)
MRTSVDVCNHLQARGVKHELVTLDGPVKNAANMADILGLKPKAVIKTLLFIADGTPVMAMVPGNCKADKDKLKQHLKAEIVTFASETEIRTIADFQATALPPVGLKDPVTTIVDKRIKTGDIVYATGGSPNVVLKIRIADLLEVTEAAVADIVE